MVKNEVEKTPTGINALDNLLEGGLPSGDQVLITGPPGSGKSFLAIQYIYEGGKAGEPSLYVTLDSDREFVLSQAKELGFDFTELSKKGACAVVTLDPTDIYHALDELGQLVRKMKVKRLVIDSVSIMAVHAAGYKNLPEDLIAFLQESKHAPPITVAEAVQKQMIYYVLSRIRKLGCTTLLISELPRESVWFSRDTISEFTSDGIILLDQQILGEGNNVRTLAIVKMRRTHYRAGVYEFQIVPDKGIVLSTSYETTAPRRR